MKDQGKRIGRVTRCSSRGFVGAVKVPEPDLPVFGAFCKADSQQGNSQVVGVIYDISIEDDEFARQMATAEGLSEEQLADSQLHRQVPVEYSTLAIGYHDNQGYHYALPPQPPLTLATIFAMQANEILSFIENLDFIPIVLSASQIPVDELLAAVLKGAAKYLPEHEQAGFLLGAGRVCARALSYDLTRLENVVRQLQA